MLPFHMGHQEVQGIAQSALYERGRVRRLRDIAASIHFVDVEKTALPE